MLTDLIVVIIFQYIPVLDNHVVHFKLTQSFDANYISISLRGRCAEIPHYKEVHRLRKPSL